MWTDYIDEYCERLAPGLWGEPLNALSNIGFFIAAWLVWRTLTGRQRVGDLRALDILLFLVGLGSLAFHTFATRWSLFLDSGFITIFLLVYLHRFLIRRVGSGPWLAAAGVVGFVALDTFLKRVMAGLPLNGSEFYAAAFFVLLAMAAWLQHYGSKAARASTTSDLANYGNGQDETLDFLPHAIRSWSASMRSSRTRPSARAARWRPRSSGPGSNASGRAGCSRYCCRPISIVPRRGRGTSPITRGLPPRSR